MTISPTWSKEDLLDAITANAPFGESINVSLQRLSAAIKADGLWDEYCPASVWVAYTEHPEMHRDREEVMREWREGRLAKRTEAQSKMERKEELKAAWRQRNLRNMNHFLELLNDEDFK